MYSKELDLNSYINCLWSYFQSYNKSIKQNLKNHENKWLKILERSKLKLSIDIINKLLRDPNNIFKLVKYNDLDINQIQILKLRYFLILYWLNYLIVTVNNQKKVKLFEFDKGKLKNWSEAIQTLITIFSSRSEVMLNERDKIYDNLKELEKIRLKCPKLDQVHQNRLESQLKALRYILNIDLIDDLRNLNVKINELNSNKFDKLSVILNGISNLESNFKQFLELYDHLSNEILIKYIKTSVKIFKVTKSGFEKLVRSNLKYQIPLNKYKEIIFNPNSLTWISLDKIKEIELNINLKDTNLILFLINKTDKVCHLIYKTLQQFNGSLLENNSVDSYLTVQEDILKSIDNLVILKNNNYNVLEDLEKEFNYSDLKDLDLEFYYQFLIHINSLVYSIKKNKIVEIDMKKYISNDQFVNKNNIDEIIKILKDRFVSKKDFNNKIHQIENRLDKVEDDKSNHVLGTVVISLISLFIWRKMINFRIRN